jgi:flagellar hook assembly protein FlgD
LTTWYAGYFDMHWLIDCFVPEYGWVRMETSTGAHPTYAQLGTTVAYDRPQDSPAGLAIYDIQGHRVRMLVDGDVVAGHHLAAWDGRDDQGRALDPGVYLCRLETAGTVRTCKLVRLH